MARSWQTAPAAQAADTGIHLPNPANLLPNANNIHVPHPHVHVPHPHLSASSAIEQSVQQLCTEKVCYLYLHSMRKTPTMSTLSACLTQPRRAVGPD